MQCVTREGDGFVLLASTPSHVHTAMRAHTCSFKCVSLSALCAFCGSLTLMRSSHSLILSLLSSILSRLCSLALLLFCYLCPVMDIESIPAVYSSACTIRVASFSTIFRGLSQPASVSIFVPHLFLIFTDPVLAISSLASWQKLLSHTPLLSASHYSSTPFTGNIFRSFSPGSHFSQYVLIIQYYPLTQYYPHFLPSRDKSSSSPCVQSYAEVIVAFSLYFRVVLSSVHALDCHNHRAALHHCVISPLLFFFMRAVNPLVRASLFCHI